MVNVPLILTFVALRKSAILDGETLSDSVGAILVNCVYKSSIGGTILVPGKPTQLIERSTILGQYPHCAPSTPSKFSKAAPGRGPTMHTVFADCLLKVQTTDYRHLYAAISRC